MRRTVVIFIFSLAVFTLTPAQTDSNVVALYGCNEGTGNILQDSSGKNNNGTIYNGTWTNGVSGKAVNFQSANQSYVEIANSQSFDFPEMTIEMWVKPTTISYQYLFSKGNDNGNASFPGDGSILMVINNGQVKFEKKSSVQSQSFSINSKTILVANQSYYVAATYKIGGTASIYINGILDSTKTAATILSSSTYKCQLGKMNGDPNFPYPYNGLMDNIRISKIQRTSADIAAFCNPDTNPIVLYRCNEGTGNILQDSSGKNNNGTIYNGTWTNGVSGKAVNFQSANQSYVEIANSQSFDFPEMTIEMWVKPTTISYQYLFSKGNDNGNASFPGDGSILMVINNGQVKFEKKSSVQSQSFSINSKTILVANQSYYVAATYKIGGTASIYINGILDSTKTAATILSSSTYKCQLGKMNGDPNFPYPYNGLMDNIRISKFQRTSADIAAFCNPGITKVVNKSLLFPHSVISTKSFPNPIRTTTTIRYSIPFTESLDISIYDVNGKLTKKVFSGIKQSGSYNYTWDGSNLSGESVANGKYFFIVHHANGQQISEQLIMLK